MKHYRVRAEMESPLVVRRQRQSQRSEGVQHLSGTLLRGAFAQVYLQCVGEADAVFQRMFLDEETCRFGPLDPADRLFPLTAYSCKRHPGFTEDGKHGVVDRLTELLAPRLGGQKRPYERCANCGQEIKPHAGFWRLGDDGRPTDPKRLWRRTLAAHVGIDRYTHTAEDSIFFTLPVLEPEPTDRAGEAGDTQVAAKWLGALEPEPADRDRRAPAVLHGWLDAEDDVLETLQKLLDDEKHVLRVGHARTRGYGRLRVTIAEEIPAPITDWKRWSESLLSRAATDRLDPSRYFLFTLSLPTGAVLVDELLRYSLDPAGMVPWLPRLPPPDPAARTCDSPGKAFEGGRLRCVTAAAHHERLRGWNAAHGLPRQDEWAVTRGAVYAYLLEGNDEARVALRDGLLGLQAHGIGARRNEGFGRVVICDEFHDRFTSKEAT